MMYGVQLNYFELEIH